MYFLRYIMINIKDLMRNKPGLFMFLIIAQIVSVVAVMLAYGFIQNAAISDRESEIRRVVFVVDFGGEEEIVTHEEYDDHTGRITTNTYKSSTGPNPLYYIEYKAFNEQLLNLVDFLGEEFDHSLFNICNKSMDCFASAYYEKNPTIGTLFEKDNMSKERLVVAGNGGLEQSIYEGNIDDLLQIKYEIGDYKELFGEKYKVTGVQERADRDVINYACVPEDCMVSSFQFDLYNIPTQKRVDQIVDELDKLFPAQKYVWIPEVLDLAEFQKSNFLRGVSIAVIALVLINAALFYRYILHLRNKWLSIVRLCGCTKSKAFCLYFMEIMCILIVCIAIAMAIFILSVLPGVQEMYSNMEYIYSIHSYKDIILSYIGVAAIIMGVCIEPAVKKPVTDMKRG